MNPPWNSQYRPRPEAAGPSRPPFPRIQIPNADNIVSNLADTQNDRLGTSNFRLQHLGQLHTQRIYILNSLQQENSKATEILDRILSVEESLHLNGASQPTRRPRKQLGWLRHRLIETNRQEKAMLARLRELTSEIQSIEAIIQIETEQYNQSFQICNNMQELHLDPTSPEFRPRHPPIQWAPVKWSPQQCQSEYTSGYQINDAGQGQNLDPQTEVEGHNDICPNDQYMDYDTRPRTPRSASADSAMMSTPSTNSPPMGYREAKRHSLPAIPGLPIIWSLTNEEKESEVETYESDPTVHRS